jgi:hypothetical protein
VLNSTIDGVLPTDYKNPKMLIMEKNYPSPRRKLMPSVPGFPVAAMRGRGALIHAVQAPAGEKENSNALLHTTERNT